MGPASQSGWGLPLRSVSRITPATHTLVRHTRTAPVGYGTLSLKEIPMDGSLDAGSMEFLYGPLAAAGKGGLLGVAGALAGIVGGVAGSIGLGLVVQGFLPR